MYLRQAERVLALEKHFGEMATDKLHEVANELREVFRRRRDGASDLERAFALIREVAFRRIGEKPFKVQVAGALALEKPSPLPCR